MSGKEPEQLRRGKRFHRKVQDSWLRKAEGQVTIETRITKPTGKRGRVDVLVDPDEDDVAVVEIKASDWDAMSERAVRRNVRRHVNQIMDYADSQVTKGKSASIGIIFPKRPASPERLRLVEDLFDAHGIPVVWEDETAEEHRARVERSPSSASE